VYTFTQPLHLGIEGHELIDEMRFELGKLTRDMCTHFIMQYPNQLKEGNAQKGEALTTPDGNQPIARLISINRLRAIRFVACRGQSTISSLV